MAAWSKAKRFFLVEDPFGPAIVTYTPISWEDNPMWPFFAPEQVDGPGDGPLGWSQQVLAADARPVDLRRYDLMSFAIEPRWQAQGRHGLARSLIGDNSINIERIWASRGVVDVGRVAGNLIERPYGHHMWHSGQYNSMLQEQCTYWREVLKSMSITHKPLVTSGQP